MASENFAFFFGIIDYNIYFNEGLSFYFYAFERLSDY